MPSAAEIVHERLKAFLLSLRPQLLGAGVDQDRLANLRRLSDVRIRKFAVEKPAFSAQDLCGLLADPRVGRFDDLAQETGLLGKGHLSITLPWMGEDMGYLTEACLTLQAAGLEAMRGYAQAFVKRSGAVAAPAPAPRAKSPVAATPAARALPPPVARALGALGDLSRLPPAAAQALKLLRGAEPPADRLTGAIEGDPALASLVLRFAHASSGTGATSLKRVLVAAGYPEFERLVQGAALAQSLGPPYLERDFSDRDYWRRALEIAHAAAQVAKASRLGNPALHFHAGLHHAIGRLAGAKARAASGTPPGELGAAILERWGFPAPVVEAARHHETPLPTIEDLEIPREAVVVAALSRLSGKPGPEEARGWAALLRLPPEALGPIQESARRAAEEAAP